MTQLLKQPLIVVRPQPGLNATVAAARALGFETIAAPLFDIEPASWRAPDPADFDAILAGSANAFRWGGEALATLTALPVHAVGGRTARAAEELGFAVARSGEGGLQAVLDSLARPARLLRLAGEARVALQVPAGVEIEERVVYRAAPLSLSDEAADVLSHGAIVLLHSAEAAKRFGEECDRLLLDRAGIALAALGGRIAAAAGHGWRSVASADRPTDDRLLALARSMCQ